MDSKLGINSSLVASFRRIEEPVINTSILSHYGECIWMSQAKLVVLHAYRLHRLRCILGSDNSGREVGVEQLGPRPIGERDQIYFLVPKHTRHLIPGIPPHVQKWLCLWPSALCIKCCPDCSIASQLPNRRDKLSLGHEK